MLDLPFVQEVIANKTAIKTFMPETDVVIELGGEDAKILYLSGGLEQRMNGTLLAVQVLLLTKWLPFSDRRFGIERICKEL